jgi:cytochrome c-type biogenesis protein CcmH/NrfG
MSQRRRAALIAAIGVSLTWAAVEARHLGRREPAPGPSPLVALDAAEVEAAFSDLAAARDGGRREEVMLGLRDRTTRGPHAGYAWFLLGEMAYDEEAFGAAVRHYRKAVETDPSVADRDAAFSSARVIATRLEAILQGPWSTRRPPDVRDLYYLQRRLAGGCE